MTLPIRYAEACEHAALDDVAAKARAKTDKERQYFHDRITRLRALARALREGTSALRFDADPDDFIITLPTEPGA